MYKMHDLAGIGRCFTKRGHNLELSVSSDAKAMAKKSHVIRNIIKDVLYGRRIFDSLAIRDEINKLFSDLPYASEETRERQAKDAYSQIDRYLLNEKRAPVDADVKQISMYGICDVEVNPDLLFVGESERIVYDGDKAEIIKVPSIEVVKLRCSKPSTSLRGRKKDSAAEKNLQLASMLVYAREYANEQGFEDYDAKASFYFLRKSSDSVRKGVFDYDFFDEKDNVCTLVNQVTEGKLTQIDDEFCEQFKTFTDGEDVECSKDNCERCDYYCACKFNKPPIYEEKERKQKSLSELILSDDQEKAIGFRDGVVRINAGAGAGKTMVIALRVAMMIAEGTLPENICLVTFTNAGANEMRERIALYLEDLEVECDLETLICTTFNSFGNEIIKKEYKQFGFAREPRLIDEVQKSSMIASLIKANIISDLDYYNFTMDMVNAKGALPMAKAIIDIIKREQITRPDLPSIAKIRSELDRSNGFCSDDSIKELINLFPQYEETMKNGCLIDYTDQELLPFELYEMDPFYLETNFNIQHVIVDESQDTSPRQFEFIKWMIDTPYFKSLMFVGDDSQSIFGFRGTTPEFMINFFDELGIPGEDLYLLDNYRSTPEILNFANAINAINRKRIEKDLVAKRKHGNPVVLESFFTTKEMTKRVCKIIKEEVANGRNYEDIAYIAATRNELMRVGTALSEEGIPWIMLNPEPVMENSRVEAGISLGMFWKDLSLTKDAFVYLNAIEENELLNNYSDAEISDMIDFLREQIINTYKDKSIKAEEEFMNMLKTIGDEDEVFNAFVKSIENITGPRALQKKLAYIADYKLYGEKETVKREQFYPGVILTTAHSSKGMEFPVVINDLTKFDRGSVNPHNAATEERRRLFFVSATRAKDQLYLVGLKFSSGSKAKGNQVCNMFLSEAYKVLELEMDLKEPVKEKKKKGAA